MRLSKFFKLMGLFTVLALIYINMQMQIFDLAYQGKRKEKEIKKLMDANSNVTYNILRLKSSNNLGIKLLTEQSGLKFMDNSRIVKLKTNEPAALEPNAGLAQKAGKKPNLLASMFSLKSQAEAKPIE